PADRASRTIGGRSDQGRPSDRKWLTSKVILKPNHGIGRSIRVLEVATLFFLHRGHRVDESSGVGDILDESWRLIIDRPTLRIVRRSDRTGARSARSRA